MNTRHYYLRLLRTFALAALTAAATAACSDDTDTDREPLTPPDGADGIPVTFTADINPGSDADPAAPDTRTVLKPDGGGFTVKWKGKNDYANNCDNILIWAAKENMLENNGIKKIYVPTTSAASSELEPMNAGEKLTLSSAGEWTFTAICGYIGSEIGGADISIFSLTQSAPGNTDHIAWQDFSVATATKHVETGDMPDINLRFKHKLSALQLRVTNQTGEELTVKEIRLSAAGGEITRLKVYDVATGGWKANREAKAPYLQLIAQNFPALATGGASQDLHMLLFPEPEHSGTNMTVTVITDRGEYSRTRPAPDGGFLAAKNYLTNIVIKTDGLDPATEKWVETISNKAELIAFRDKVNGGNTYQGKTVRLAADIDLANETWTTPIGNSSNMFQGTFDGGGYSISNLTVDTGSEGDAGLFGGVFNGTVRNLRVSGTVTTTVQSAGGIAGTLYHNCTVENCIFSGTVSGKKHVGGIVGTCSGSRIAGCHTKGKVTATDERAGGIAGYIEVACTLTDCYSESEVKVGLQNAGGIAGENRSTITHCYATGNVSGQLNVGGIAGKNMGSVTGCIALNPGITRTEGSETTFGRVVGNNNDGLTPTNCAAYEGMTITDNASQPITGTGEAGTALPAAACLAKDTYTTTLGFAEPTATTPGWAFDTATPWAYLPWNKIFDSWNISETEYRIAVPDYLKAPVIN